MHLITRFRNTGSGVSPDYNRPLKTTMAVVLLTLGALAISACSSGPPPRLYLLESSVQADDSESAEQSDISALGISRVTLPGYASDARIATLLNNGVVRQLDSERWAEDPEDAITRLFAERLRTRASATVLVEPWPRNYRPEARVEVIIDKLLRRIDGGAQISGQIQLLSGDGRDLMQSIAFDERALGRTVDVAEFFEAVAVIIDEAARVAIEVLLTTRQQS